MGNTREIVYKGTPYPSVSALAKDLDIKRSTLSMAINNNPDMSVEEVVNKVRGLDKETLITIDGVEYKSYSQLAKAFDINVNTINSRLTEGYSLYDAVTNPVVSTKKPIKYKGEDYESITDLLKVYGLDLSTYKNRKRLGWDLDRILSYKVGEIGTGKAEPIEFKGETYPSKARLADAYGAEYSDFIRKLGYGWTIEEALGLVPVNFNEPPVKHQYKTDKVRELQ